MSGFSKKFGAVATTMTILAGGTVSSYAAQKTQEEIQDQARRNAFEVGCIESAAQILGLQASLDRNFARISIDGVPNGSVTRDDYVIFMPIATLTDVKKIQIADAVRLCEFRAKKLDLKPGTVMVPVPVEPIVPVAKAVAVKPPENKR